MGGCLSLGLGSGKAGPLHSSDKRPRTTHLHHLWPLPWVRRRSLFSTLHDGMWGSDMHGIRAQQAGVQVCATATARSPRGSGQTLR